MPKPMAPVTGIAPAGLGTATNLDDTQRYAIDDLVIDDRSPTIAFVHEPVRPVTRRRLPKAHLPDAGMSSRMVAIVAFAVLALAAVLTLRDGALTGPGSFGGALGGQDAITGPPLTTNAPAPTAEPAATPKGKHGHGHGGGHGH